MSDLDHELPVIDRREDIPKFADDAEAAAFWSTHALGDGLFAGRGPRSGSPAEKLSRQRFRSHATSSKDADAVYVYLAWGRLKRSEKLDESRLVDYADSGDVIGVQFLDVSKGIDLRGVPQRQQVEELVKDLHLRILA